MEILGNHSSFPTFCLHYIESQQEKGQNLWTGLDSLPLELSRWGNGKWLKALETAMAMLRGTL